VCILNYAYLHFAGPKDPFGEESPGLDGDGGEFGFAVDDVSDGVDVRTCCLFLFIHQDEAVSVATNDV